MCFVLFFSQKICCAPISLIVFPEKKQSNCLYNLYSRMCICAYAYVYAYFVCACMCVY